mgnify:CR=1 FL=1
MRILVTGANGYLGQGIVKAIIDSGNDVIAADFQVDHVDDRAEKRECNLFDVENPYVYFDKRTKILFSKILCNFMSHSSKTTNEKIHRHLIQKLSYPLKSIIISKPNKTLKLIFINLLYFILSGITYNIEKSTTPILINI